MFLAIDTSSEQTSVSLGNLDCGRREFNSLSSERFGEHAEELSLLVSRLLKESGLSIADLDGVTLTTGPGSFTGIRIGLSYAKGICSACSIPLYSFDNNSTSSPISEGTINSSEPLPPMAPVSASTGTVSSPAR